MKVATSGEVMRRLTYSFDQPRPNGPHGSRCSLTSPNSVSLSRVHSLARFMLGEPEFGLVNAHLEPWGPFGRGWANEYINVRMNSQNVATFIAYPKAWTPGTNDAVHAQVVRVVVRRTPQCFAKDLEEYKGKLARTIVT